MRRVLLISGAAVMLFAAIVGCTKKTDSTAMQSTNDSLLAANPVEQPQGTISPQTQYQNDQKPPQTSEAPPSTPVKHTKHSSAPKSTSTPREEPGVTLAAGTPIEATVATQLSSETAQVGSTWTGTVDKAVIVGDRVVIPEGSTVNGIVTAVQPAQKGSRASLDLEVRSVNVNGKTIDVEAPTESIVAGSTRARNIGGIAAGVGGGALIGKAVGGNKGALIGGLLGGATAGGVVAKSKGYQVVVKEGTKLTFTVRNDVKVRA
jgi:hypothetical protein